VASFLKRLMGGHEPPPPELAEATKRLDELARTRPAINAPVHAMRDVLTALLAEPVGDASVSMTPETAQSKLAAGIPLLRGEPAPGDQSALRKRWFAVTKAFEGHQGRSDYQALAKAAKSGTLEPHLLLGEVLAGNLDVVGTAAASLGLDPSLMGTVLRLASLPMLAAVASRLEPLRSGNPWDRGFCPVCGSWPLLGEYRGLEQTRFLRCGLCAASWEFSRFRCPFCDERDHRQLAYIHADGEQDRWRAATCDSCHSYVKMVASLDSLSWPLLLVQDVATLHLDLAAADRGFMVR